MEILAGAAGPQRNGTQGIARVEFRNGDSVVKTLPACAVCLPKGDETYINMLGLQTLSSNERSKYYVIGPWFEEVRPRETYNKVTVFFHRFRKTSMPKEFPISEDSVQSVFQRFGNSNFFVIACKLKGKLFKSSRFLKKWRSKLVLCNGSAISNEMSRNNASVWGFKKDGELLKYTEIQINGSAQDLTIEENLYSSLMDCGLILIQLKLHHYKVIGCYQKRNSEIQISCLHSNSTETLYVKVANIQHHDEAEQHIETSSSSVNNSEAGALLSDDDQRPLVVSSAHTVPNASEADSRAPQLPRVPNTSEVDSREPLADLPSNNPVQQSQQPGIQVSMSMGLINIRQQSTQYRIKIDDIHQENNMVKIGSIYQLENSPAQTGNQNALQVTGLPSNNPAPHPQLPRVTPAAAQTGNQNALQVTGLPSNNPVPHPQLLARVTPAAAHDQTSNQDSLQAQPRRVTSQLATGDSLLQGMNGNGERLSSRALESSSQRSLTQTGAVYLPGPSLIQEDRETPRILRDLSDAEQDLPDLVTDLPEHMLQKICDVLNEKDPFYRDYRMFAEELGMEKSEIENLSLNNSKSWTQSVLKKYKVTTKEFLKVIQIIIERNIENIANVMSRTNELTKIAKQLREHELK